ncbi:5-formyltetrahydrofolate cyclo-ligase [Luteimonas aquatica]|uniref:5-formyltetrahydrofolate cyclo-ligase n=1 Tax=Luteimonas aquatica TaxID=450364 RepID=UPI001F592026|nr:5-formyltetrahydrofolate cyclo-ligase [Luteimonas aquatica]
MPERSATSDPRLALRRELRARRRAIPAAERIAAAERLADRLLALSGLPAHGPVAGYWAVDGEIGLHAWQLRLPAACTYCLPVLREDGRLRFAPWRPGAPLLANRHGIPEPDVADDALLEPEAMALVVAPLVAFDARRHRLGMGAGWYDRSFAFRHERAAPPALVGAAFAMQQVDALDAAAWDVPLDAVCTELDTFSATD